MVRLQRLCLADGINMERCAFGIQTVRNWSHGGDKRRKDWVLVILNALRDGWALKGYVGPGAPVGGPFNPANRAYRTTPETSAPISDHEKAMKAAIVRLGANGGSPPFSRDEIDEEIERHG